LKPISIIGSYSGAKTYFAQPEPLIFRNLQISTVDFMNDWFWLNFGIGPKLMAILRFAIGFGPKPKKWFWTLTTYICMYEEW
jgi:hypothetical protein